MPSVYRNHDALLFTSEWAEPFALTPLEAMATGLPVIGTTTGGSRELFRHEENALTYTAGNAEELAARILQLSSDSVLRARIAAAGQREVRANYSEPVIVDQIEDFLNETVLGWNAPSRMRAHEETTGPLINTRLKRGVNESVGSVYSDTESKSAAP
jgi:glycogen synthase